MGMFCFVALLGLQKAQAIDIPFGKNGKIIYQEKIGSFAISNKGTIWLKDAVSAVHVGAKLVNVKEYTTRKVTTSNFKDDFGAGKKYVILSTQKGLPDLQQIFYTYTNTDYFLIEVAIADKANKLSSNGAIAVQGVLVDENPTAFQSLMAPFDNDTFISYESKALKDVNKMHSAEFGAFYKEKSKAGVIMGSVEQDVWKTGVLLSKNDDQSFTATAEVGYTAKDLNRDDMPHGSLEGNSISSAKVLLGKFDDWRAGMHAYATHVKALQHRVAHPWVAATPVAWNSWGVMQTGINYKDIVAVGDYFEKNLPETGNDATVYIDLDSYWDNMLKGGLEGDYSELKRFADAMKAKGLKPGCYWAPFVDWGFEGGANRRVEGTNYTYGDLWTKVKTGYHDLDGARALDPTHPGTQQRLALVINKLKECGFEMIKIDFIGHAAIESTGFEDKNVKTGMQAFHVGMKYLVEQLGDQMLIYAAISPNIATAPYVHVRRIACDAYNDIGHTRYTLNGLTYGWWQTHLYDYVDADHLVFKDASDSENKARFVSGLLVGTIVFGDDFSKPGKWNILTAEWMKNPEIWKVIRDGKSFEPQETDAYAAQLFTKTQDGTTYVAVLNYGEEAQHIPLQLGKLMGKAKQNYQLMEVFDNEKIALTADASMLLTPKSAKLFKILTN